MEISKTRKKELQQMCLQNARRHLEAAKILNANGSSNLAFHSALLALEEAGKSVIVMMTQGNTQHDDEEPSQK